jgi:hypothetical protein
MHLPGFTAEASLGKSTRTYRARYRYGGLSQNQSGLPAHVLPSQLEGTEDLEDLEEAQLMAEMGADEEMEAEETEFEEEPDTIEAT